jgi:hypothetical protein
MKTKQFNPTLEQPTYWKCSRVLHPSMISVNTAKPPCGEKRCEGFGQPFQVAGALIAEESACSRTQAVPSPLPVCPHARPWRRSRSRGSLRRVGAGAPTPPLPDITRGFPAPPPTAPPTPGADAPKPGAGAAGWRLGQSRWRAGASQEPPCGGREGCGVREGPHGTLFAALTRTGTPVNAAVGGPVNALHGLPPPRAGLPGTFLPPMGAAPCSNGHCTVPHPSPPGAREGHRLRPCQTKVGLCWGTWGSSPHPPARLLSLAGMRPSVTRRRSQQAGPRQACVLHRSHVVHLG